jgi:CubicO group peptidase (beta-lactamase class C family)
MNRWNKICVLLAIAVSVGARAQAPSVAARLQPFVESHSLAGAVTAVATAEKVISLEAVGYSDIAAGESMKTDAVFWIASMSKPMTATALMMLVEEGKVNVNDPVEKYLPEYRGQWLIAEQSNGQMVLKKPAHPITVKNVLTHTSGLPHLSRIEHLIDTYPLREAAISYGMSPLQSEPDTKYAYCNAGINTVGRIIEVVSGKPYEQFMEERLLKPLGMKDTTLWPTGEQMNRLAKSYRPTKDKAALQELNIDQLTYPLQNRSRGASPAGGYFSTAADMAIFGQMILRGGELGGKRYLSEQSVKQMTSAQTGDVAVNPNNKDAAYGFGWSTSHTPDAPFGHGGAYATNLSIDPKRGIVTVFMVQHAGFGGTDGGKILPTFMKTAAELSGK